MIRPRFNLRTLLAVVAVAGLLAWVQTMRRRSADFRLLAAYHNARISVGGGPLSQGVVLHLNDRGMIIFSETLLATDTAFGSVDETRRRIEEYRRRIRANQEWHAAMKWKYLRAAARPWLLVEPDTPEPVLPKSP